MKCEECKTKIKPCYRFTDWDNDYNDEYGTYEECLKMFNDAVKEEPEGRYSIYDVSECECGFKDEGVLYNEKCPEYSEVEE